MNHPRLPQTFGGIPGLTGTAGMADLLKPNLSDKTRQG